MGINVKRVKDWILRTGFPLEIETIDILKNRGWEVMASTNYFDDDEEKWRELDIKAFKHIDFGIADWTPAWPYRITFSIIIQCKKSGKFAWVFFPLEGSVKDRGVRILQIDFLKIARVQSLATRQSRSLRGHRHLGLSRGILTEPPLLSHESARQIRWLSEIVPVRAESISSFTDGTTASIGTVAPLGGQGEGRDEIFEEAATATKAAVYEVEIKSDFLYDMLSFLRTEAPVSPIEPPPPLDIDMILPIIVFDGPMFLWRGKGAELEATNQVVYQFSYRSSNYFGAYLLNVVSKASLGKLLDGLETDLSRLAETFRDKKDEINKQVKLIVQGV